MANPTIKLLFPSGRPKTDWRIMAVSCAIYANRFVRGLPQTDCTIVHRLVRQHITGCY